MSAREVELRDAERLARRLAELLAAAGAPGLANMAGALAQRIELTAQGGKR